MVAATVALEDHAVESAEGAVANECANMIRKFVHEMRCRYASYGSAIHSYLPIITITKASCSDYKKFLTVKYQKG